MYQTYSYQFKEQALLKVYNRGERTIESVAEELNIKLATLKIWMKRKQKQIRIDGATHEVKERRPQDWRIEEKLIALQETYALNEVEKSAWCRSKGIFPHDLIDWANAICKPNSTHQSAAQDKQELRTLKDKNIKLEKDLARKEKALVEAAALLILQKKFNALWEDEDK